MIVYYIITYVHYSVLICMPIHHTSQLYINILTFDNHVNTLYTGTIIEDPSSVIYLPGLTPLPIELTCNVTGVVTAWRINGTSRGFIQLLNNQVPGHSLEGVNIQVNIPVNNTEYICVFIDESNQTGSSDPAYIFIAGEYDK